MRRPHLTACLAMLALALLAPTPARAGKPWPRTFTCCVLEGLLLNIEGGLLLSHEGKLVRADGDLLPGDRFVVRPPLASIDRALALVPDSCSFRLTRAEVREGLGELKRAHAEAEQAVKAGCQERWDLEILERLTRRLGR